MFGRTVFFFALAAALVGVVCWFNLFGRLPLETDRTLAGPFDYGPPLYPAVELPENPVPPALVPAAEPMVFPDFPIYPMDVTNLPAQAEGQILFIGTIVEEKDVKNYPPGTVQRVDIFRGGKKEPYFYRRLKETDKVVKDQVLGMINPAKAFDKLDIAKVKLEMAKAETLAAKSAYDLASQESERADKLISSPGTKAISSYDVNVSRFQKEKAYREMLSKAEQIKAAQSEVYSAETDASWYVLRNPLEGVSVIKSIDKKAGDAAKNLETVLQLQNDSLLRAEGMVEVPYLGRLLARKGTKVRVEPTYEEAPLRTLLGHRREVTGVAVSEDRTGPVLISGSLDKSVRIWDAAFGTMRGEELQHPEAVRAVAAAPKGSASNWFLSACADGSVRLWDLDDLKHPVLLNDNPHRDAVTALAFSPDGQWFATGGADNLICVWHTQDAMLVYRLDADHGVDNPPQGQITSLTLTPQGRLVAAGRDNTLRVWELCAKGARPVRTIFDRGGTVAQLGVSADGRRMLFDQGKMLQVMAVPGGRVEAVVKKPSTATPFETLALFSPDGKLILTAGAAEGRLQLWTAATAENRAFEVRVLSPGERSSVSCAAFAPAGVTLQGRAFAVNGTRDGQVLIWPLPTDKEIAEAPRAGTLTMVDTALEPGARQARVGVEIENPDGRLNPGKQATVVIMP
jgi:WD40 repeat protein